MLETDLFPPVCEWLEASGYEVNAEVKDCDVVATKGDDIIIVELKTSANMSLLVQATDRQRITDSVYVAVPRPSKTGKHWRGIQRVIRQLEVGLLVVSFGALGARVDKLHDPLPWQRRKQGRRQRAVLQEVSERSKNYNVGGMNGQTIVTAYRERAIMLATFLDSLGASTPKTLRRLGTGDNTTSILASNYYGWFQRVDRGVYEVTNTGRDAMTDYPELHDRARRALEEKLKAP